MRCGNEGFDGLCPAGHQDLDGSVGAVADPAVEAKPCRFLDHEMAIADGLHKAFDAQAQGCAVLPLMLCVQAMIPRSSHIRTCANTRELLNLSREN